MPTTRIHNVKQHNAKRARATRANPAPRRAPAKAKPKNTLVRDIHRISPETWDDIGRALGIPT